MGLPRNGFVQPVEVVAGGPLPRNGFVQPVEVIGGAPSSATPVAGGSGQFYASITAALAGEVQTVVSGLVPQAGTGPGVIVGPGTLSAVDNFYKDMFVLNTSPNPSNGLVAQWARVSSYVGATRTFTIDKPWDFSAEASFEVIDPVRVMVFLNLQEDVNVNKNLILDFMGNRLQGKVDISSADFCWIHGGSGYVTNGIQKTDFGVLKLDDLTTSRRDSTIYALLFSNGSDLGRGDIKNCEFDGVVSSRRGKFGWGIYSSTNTGLVDGIPYRLVESVAGVSISATQLDISIDSQFSGAFLYSENSITGAAFYLSVQAYIRSATSLPYNGTIPSRRVSVCHAIGTATLTFTANSGGFNITESQTPQTSNQFTEFASSVDAFSYVTAGSAFSGTINVLFSFPSNLVQATFLSISSLSIVAIEGSSDISGSITVSGTSTIFVNTMNNTFFVVILKARLTGSISVSNIVNASNVILSGHIYFASNQDAGAPTITISGQFQWFNCFQHENYLVLGGVTVSVGTWTISGPQAHRAARAVRTRVLLASGGSFVLSNSLTAAMVDNTAGGVIVAQLTGTGGSLTVSSPQFYSGAQTAGLISQCTATGGSVSCSSNITFTNCYFTGAWTLVAATTSTSSATLSGIILFVNCTFAAALTIVNSTPGGAAVTGPSSVGFEVSSLESTITTETGAGTITWTGAAIVFKTCHIEGLFTIVLTRFSTVQGFSSTFNGNASNKAITASGTRPATYRYWKCNFSARFDDIQPEVLNEYDILPAQAALVQGQPVKVNTANQYQVCVAASVVDGVLIAAAGGAGTIAIAVRKGRVYVNVNPAVANGDNLVLDTVTPTRANTAAVAVVGQEIGTALEAAGATIAGLAYTAVNTR